MKPIVKLLKPEEGKCPRCLRLGMKGKRHKERARGDWCSGRRLSPEEAKKRKDKDQAFEEFRRLREAFWKLRWAGRHAEARALCLRGTQVLSYRLREVSAREKADEAGLD